MDGNFVKTKSIKLSEIPNLSRYNTNFEAHLMVEKPERYISQLKRKGFKKIIFHYESLNDNNKIEELVKKIKNFKLEVFIALNPETSISKIIPFLRKINGILVLGVHPGKEHQDFIPEVYNKIKNLREFNKDIIIEVDGGVNEEAASKLALLGVDIINTGSFVSNAKNPKQALEKLEKAFIA